LLLSQDRDSHRDSDEALKREMSHTSELLCATSQRSEESERRVAELEQREGDFETQLADQVAELDKVGAITGFSFGSKFWKDF